MKITILSVGKVKEKFYRDAIDEFAKRLSRYCKFEIIEVMDEKTQEQASENEIRLVKEKEGERLLKNIKDDALILDLASRPGGVDMDAASSLGIKVIWALGLPGKCAPVTSGHIIGSTILNILSC